MTEGRTGVNQGTFRRYRFHLSPPPGVFPPPLPHTSANPGFQKLGNLAPIKVRPEWIMIKNEQVSVALQLHKGMSSSLLCCVLNEQQTWLRTEPSNQQGIRMPSLLFRHQIRREKFIWCALRKKRAPMNNCLDVNSQHSD